MNLFVLGNEDIVIGFQFIGIRGAIVNSKEEAFDEFKKVTTSQYGDIAILIITEKIMLLIEEDIVSWQMSGEYPLIVEIPDIDGHIEGKKSLLQTIREAIGLPV